MRVPLRLALVVVGLAVAVYGIASLTGAWLGTPPWWETTVRQEVEGAPALTHFREFNVRRQPQAGRLGISAAVIAAGLGIAGVAAWPRRPRPDEAARVAP